MNVRNLIVDYRDVPETWIFEYYCKLDRKLIGQDEKIKSLFNLRDKIPSMCIYFNKVKNNYKFKDFSTGIQGDAFELVKNLYNLSHKEAIGKILDDYKYYLANNTKYEPSKFKTFSKFKVTSYAIRSWNTLDRDYWIKYNIGTGVLNKYNVIPLSEYIMEKNDDEGNELITITGNYIYGYFKNNGELYKIYQPKNNKKFINVASYIQGSEQLENHSKLLITSSLKDIMSIKSLKLKIDCISPDSENTMLPDNIMINYLELYNDNVAVSFDNDNPGIEAMKKYRSKYNVNVFILPLSKDPSDSIKDHGVKKVLYTLIPILHRVYK